MLGLWYEDEVGVQLTGAGQEIVSDKAPVPILTKQLLDYQYPSAYSVNTHVDVDPEFRLHPYRFVCRLFSEGGLRELSQDEIAFCIVPFATSDNQIDETVSRVEWFRQDPKQVIKKALEKSGTSEGNLKNIGNTIVNQLEYTGYFQQRDEIKSLALRADSKPDLEKAIKGSRQTLLPAPEDRPSFQRKFGSGLLKQKDYSRTKIIPPAIDPIAKVVMEEFFKLTMNRPYEGISQEVVEEIENRRSIPPSQIRHILDKLIQPPSLKKFESRYLQLSVGGQDTAAVFEEATAGLFEEGFNIPAEWVGPKGRYPDVFTFLSDSKTLGMIDNKAYRAFGLDDTARLKMAHSYIPRFAERKKNNQTYKLGFFCYVAGGFATSIQRPFAELLTMVDIPGSYITAKNLLALLAKHKKSPISESKMLELFSLNREIVPGDF